MSTSPIDAKTGPNNAYRMNVTVTIGRAQPVVRRAASMMASNAATPAATSPPVGFAVRYQKASPWASGHPNPNNASNTQSRSAAGPHRPSIGLRRNVAHTPTSSMSGRYVCGLMTVRTHASESADNRNASADAEEMPRRRVAESTLVLERSAEDEADAVLEVRDGARARGMRAGHSQA